MGKKFVYYAGTFLLLLSFAFPAAALSQSSSQIKISVFNFLTTNLEASGYNTTVTNLLMNNLACEPSLALLDRKELEAFLNLNDLQQDDNLENVSNIGSRLGLNVIVVGSVGKKGTIIIINCKVIHVEQKRVIFETQARALGDSGLMMEIRKLSSAISTVMSNYAMKQRDAEKAVNQGPVNVQKRSGNKRVHLNWEDPPGAAAAGYEIFRGNSESGPFIKVTQVNKPEYLDQELERNTTYYYKIRSFSAKGLQSDFSAVIPAETALTPNPPVILKVEGHIKSVELTWSPSPIANDDPLKLKGYKLYRARVQEGPYREVANVLGKDLGVGADAATTLDKLFKVTYIDMGLADGEVYYYKLTAYNEKNLESDFSSPVKGTALPVVTSLTAQGDMIREIRLSWNLIESPFITGYYIFRSTSESANFAKIKKVDASESPEGKKLAYTDREGLGDKTRYFYRVTAIESPDTETSPSATVSAVTRGKPQTPQGLKAQSGLVKRVEVTWTASPHAEVEGYNLYWSKEKLGKYELLKRFEGRTTNGFTHGGGGFEKLGDNSTYYYTITAFNKVDVESDLSEAAFATTKPRPVKPSGLKAEALKVKRAPLTWQPNPEKDIDAYHIYQTAGAGEEFARIAKVSNATGYEDKGLKDGHAYRYKIQAEDRDELLSDFSDTVSVQTKPKPKTPERLTGEIRQGKVDLTWQAGQEADISHYNVYEKRFFGQEKIGTVKTAGFSETAPAKGKNKTYVVTSSDKDDLESEPSRELTISGI